MILYRGFRNRKKEQALSDYFIWLFCRYLLSKLVYVSFPIAYLMFYLSYAIMSHMNSAYEDIIFSQMTEKTTLFRIRASLAIEEHTLLGDDHYIVVLILCLVASNEPYDLSALYEHNFLTSAAVRSHIKKLLNADLMKIETTQTDKRTRCLHITEKGKLYLARFETLYTQLFTAPPPQPSPR